MLRLMNANQNIDTALEPERRKVERRSHAAESKLLARLFAFRRVFGVGTSAQIAARIGIDDEKLAQIMKIGGERRLFRRRGYSPLPKSPRRTRHQCNNEIPANTLDRNEIQALRSLYERKSSDPPIRHDNYPPKLLNMGFIFRSCDGQLQVTHHGRQALLRQSYIDGAVKVVETGRSDLIDSSVREWLESNQFISVTPSGGCEMTASGATWLIQR